MACSADHHAGHSRYCGQCGVLLYVECLHCGATNHTSNRYCSECGRPFNYYLPELPPVAPPSRPDPGLPESFPVPNAGAAGLVAQRYLRIAKARILSVRQSLDFASADLDSGLPPRSRLVAEVATVSFLTLIGFLLRVWSIGSVPSGPAGDESSIAMEVIRVLNEGWIGIWSGVVLGSPTGLMYYMAPYFWLGGPTLDMLRLSSVLPGTAMIPLCYLMVRMFYPMRVALLAAVVATFFVWFLVQSRIGFPIPLSVFMAAAGIYLLLCAVRRQRLWVALAAGLVLGLQLYAFKGNIIFFAAIFGAAAIALLFSSQLRRRWTIYLALLVALIVGAAMLDFYANSGFLAYNLQGQYRVEQADLFSIGKHLRRFIEIVLLVHTAPPPADFGFEGLDYRPLVNPLLSIFFWVGLLTTLLFINRRPSQLLLLGWLVAMAPALLVPGGEPRRYLLGAFFALLILVIGYVASVHWFTGWLLPKLGSLAFLPRELNPRRARFAIMLIAALLFSFAFVLPNLYHFYQWPHTQESQFQFNYEIPPIAAAMNSFGETHQVRFYSERWSINNEGFQWFAPTVSGVDGGTEFGGDGSIFSNGPVETPAMFILLGRYQDLLRDLRSAYPEGLEYRSTEPEYQSAFVAYVIDQPPAPGSTPTTLFYRLSPDPERTELRVGIPADFSVITNNTTPLHLVINPAGVGEPNLAYHDQDCPGQADSAVILNHNDRVSIYACSPGDGHIHLYDDATDALVQQYHVQAFPVATGAPETPGEPAVMVLPHPSTLTIRAIPTEGNLLELLTTRSVLLTASPPSALVVHNSPDLEGKDACQEVKPSPEGDTRVIIIVPESDEPFRSPFSLVGCGPGRSALQIESDGVVLQTYYIDILSP